VAVPRSPRLYHITHIDNLASIIGDGFIYSDSALQKRGGADAVVGMGHIKARRLSMGVTCHPGTKVGEYVPFNFCPRSVMLYLLHMGNHPELEYREGQKPILHLEYDFDEVIAWAERERRAWVITTINASARYAQFYAERSALESVDWESVRAVNWRDPTVKEHKQAEFLVYESAPSSLIRRIGVHDTSIREKVIRIMGDTENPLVEVRPEWYY
jgi:hypothetical protein